LNERSVVKKWITERRAAAAHLLQRIGVGNVHKLVNAALIIGISYGGKHKEGQIVYVKVDKVLFRRKSIYFEFEEAPITVSLDATPGIPLGGDLAHVGQGDDIEISGISFDDDGWVAIYSHNDAWGEMRSNLDIQVILP
jgi:hypothetical protein